MSAYLAAKIEKQPFFKLAPLISGRGRRTPYVIGFDSEADHSVPFLFQFSLPGTTEDDTLLVEIPDTPMAGFEAFMRFVATHCTNAHYEYLIYGWNLAYEWTQLFHDTSEQFRSLSEIVQPVEISGGKLGERPQLWEWHIYNDKRVFATIRNIRRKLLVRILDGMMFYVTGLDQAAKMLGLGEKRHGIDRSAISRNGLGSAEFLAYARRDAFITRRVGEHIVQLHERYDVSQTISAPHFASNVFRHTFLKGEIAHPEKELEQVGLWSYHGGKNGYYADAPQDISRVWQYDITSAYPEAMRQLPNIETAQWQRVTEYVPGRHAIYQCTLDYRRCMYRGVLTHEGTWPDSGLLVDICLTSYELDAMLQRGECDVHSLFGWEFRGAPGGPLVDYVDTFFALKSTTEGAERETAKLFLNSLYGKFFQKQALGTVGYLDADTGEINEHNTAGEYDWRAGGLYHPPIASLITGYVRAKIHRLEHRYDAIMTSTDGFFATREPDPADLGRQLGGLTATSGSLAIWRDRLYIFWPDTACECDIEGMAGKPPRLCSTCGQATHKQKCPGAPKYALHGWWGCVHQLATIPRAFGTYAYSARHVVSLKESLKRFSTVETPAGAAYAPGTFVQMRRSVTI